MSTVWTSGVAVSLLSINKARFENGYDLLQLHRENVLDEFFRTSQEASPTRTPAQLDVWVEMMQDDENMGAIIKGLILGRYDGNEAPIDKSVPLEEYYRKMLEEEVMKSSQCTWLKEVNSPPANETLQEMIERFAR